MTDWWNEPDPGAHGDDPWLVPLVLSSLLSLALVGLVAVRVVLA